MTEEIFLDGISEISKRKRRIELYENKGDIHFKKAVNLEYNLPFEGHNTMEFDIKGDFRIDTIGKVDYSIKGRLLVFPLEGLDERDTDFDKDCDDQNYKVRLEYKLGETWGSTIKPSGKTITTTELEKEKIKDLCEKYFPKMAMAGNVIFSTIEPVPSEVNEGMVYGEFKKVLESSKEFRETSDMHKNIMGNFEKNYTVRSGRYFVE